MEGESFFLNIKKDKKENSEVVKEDGTSKYGKKRSSIAILGCGSSMYRGLTN
jgi:hypothetical protein